MKKVNKETELLSIQRGIRAERYVMWITCIVLMSLTAISMASAASTTAETLWTTVADLIATWVTRLGGVVMFVGGVMFGLGWKNDDAEQKSRGIQTLIAGAIVTAIAGLTSTFFA